MAALSAGASDMSGWLLLGLPGLAVINPTLALWTALGLAIGTWCNWSLLAARLRRASAASGALTVPGLLAARFPDHARWLRSGAALAILVFFLLYASAGLVAGGKLFATVFAVDYALAVLVSALVIALYTSLGGFLAVTWTDAVQAVLMSLALFAVAVAAGVDPGLEAAWLKPDRDPVGLAGIISALAWGLGYLGQPHILARFMALSPHADVAVARRIGVAWTVTALAAALAVGILAAPLVAAGTDAERVFMLGVAHYLPPLLAGVCLAGILAAIMSTADSQLLVAAAALAEDLTPAWGGIQRDQAWRVRAGRLTVAGICAVAVAVALQPNPGVFALVARAWAGFGATLAPVLLIALSARHASGAGALGGLITGGVVVALWPLLPHGGFGVYELLPGFVAATAVNLALNAALASDPLPPDWSMERV